MVEINKGMTIKNENVNQMKEKLLIKPAIIAVSGPSGAGKDYLTAKAMEYFNELGIKTINVQMTTERPHRGEVETKICISPEEYDQLERTGEMFGNHINKVRYGYNGRDLVRAINESKENGGMVIIELNPIMQKSFPQEITNKLGVGLTAWVGVKTTEEQTRKNMEERGEAEESIKQRLAIVHDYTQAMSENPMVTMCDNGPENRINSANDFIEIVKEAILENK